MFDWLDLSDWGSVAELADSARDLNVVFDDYIPHRICQWPRSAKRSLAFYWYYIIKFSKAPSSSDS